MLLRYCLNDSEMVPVVPIITGITFAFTLLLLLLLLLLSLLSSSSFLLLLEVPYVEVQIPATIKLRSSFLRNITATSLDDVPEVSRQHNNINFKGINY
jgi:hypothetical protein